ncbi:NAD(P)/FAD-dependent oxidoreductase [Oceanobacillus piezotolerans]|uniref:NAD(P)/FAD-dependent oxidoreductase n=1 Tax=Oceanobacillus piezotolerans TaxID=2448030 RepID=A0A498DFU5_9BACI|nr:NAD(P)/FAD-dependent oxidoreductase [Oceanobacillus piezotolerans]RLL46821.1 NAD(P)/FAD-dependent oxidoreductase [Oceanobacillus piezotolerans]
MVNTLELDAVVVGAGFYGIYMTHLLREGGYSVCLYEAGEEVGGTWYWNRYPGARCDTPSEFYSYTFSEELYKGWIWSSFYPEQSEILDYMKYVVDKLDLRRDIQFNSRVKSAEYDESINRWRIHLNESAILAKYYFPAIGGLSTIHTPNIKGLENFVGEKYHTSRWPHEKVDLKGKRIGVIGTGSSGVQSIIETANEAAHVTVFQRTAQYVLPVKNPLLTEKEIKEIKDNFSSLRKRVRAHPTGMPSFPILRNYSALDDTPEERNRFYEQLWEEANGFQFLFAYNDLMLNEKANNTLTEFLRKKIREIVNDPETADNLLPNYLIGGKRPVVAIDYFETYNRDNVSLVNLKKTPFIEGTERGLRTTEKEHELDIIIFASGFDVGIGPIRDANIRGRNGLLLNEKWENGANLKTFVGACNHGFPNMFLLGGCHYPLGVNVPPIAELMVKRIYDCLTYFKEKGVNVIEATTVAEESWTNLINEIGEMSFYSKVDSWFNGANIEGKPRTILGYAGDFLMYQEQISKAMDEYNGFTASSREIDM